MGSSDDLNKNKRDDVIDEILEQALRSRKDADRAKTGTEKNTAAKTEVNPVKPFENPADYQPAAKRSEMSDQADSNEKLLYHLKEEKSAIPSGSFEGDTDVKLADISASVKPVGINPVGDSIASPDKVKNVEAVKKPGISSDTIVVDAIKDIKTDAAIYEPKNRNDIANKQENPSQADSEVKIYVPPASSNKGIFQETRQFHLDSSTSKKLSVKHRLMQLADDEPEGLEQLDIEGLLMEAGVEGAAESELSEKKKKKAAIIEDVEAAVSSDSNEAEKAVSASENKSDGKWEEEFHKSREKKADKFKLSFKIAGEEEENEPEEEYQSFSDEELDDYKSYNETSDVKAGLNYRKKMAWFRFFLTLGVTGILLVLTIFSQFGIKMSPYFEGGAGVFLLLVALIVNHLTIGIGFRELFRLSPSSETVVAVPAVAVFLHTIGKLLPSNINDEKYLLWTVVGAGALLYGSIGELLMIRRIAYNFKFVSYPQDKFTINTIDDNDLAVEIGRNSVALGTPTVAYSKKTAFLSHFLENSYERDVSDRACGIFCFISIAVSLVAAILYGVVHKSPWRAFSAFVLTLSFSLPFGAMTSSHLPIYRVAKKILRYGGMIVGWQAARDFGDVHAVAVDAKDLFPSDNVLLHGIKTFSGTRIDKAILDAAAVSVVAGGPLSFVFRRIIQENDAILPEVDTVVFEQDMGVSGWVDGRRVLIGNRTLLENHGVDTPSKDYEARYAVEGRKIVYLSVAGELSSMFVVSYIPDMSIARALDSLANADVTLLVRTSDPNITEEFLCEVYDLDDYYVEIMKASSGRSYDGLIADKKSRSEAVAASNGRLEGVAYALSGCRNLGKSVKLGVIIQIIGAALGLALALLFVLFTAIVPTPLTVFGYSLFWVVLSWLIPMGYRA